MPAPQPVRSGVIDGHRDTNDTACPGQLLYDQLPEVRRLVQERIQAAQVPPVTITTPFQLTGDPVVGGTLTVTPGAYSPTDAVVTYTWLRNGIPTGDDPALTVRPLAPEDLGQQLAVVVDLRRDGYTGATQSLGPTAPIETQAVLQVQAHARRGKIKVIVRATAVGVYIPLPGELLIRVDQRPWRRMPLGGRPIVSRFLGFGPGEHEVKVRFRGQGVVRSVRSRVTVRVKN